MALGVLSRMLRSGRSPREKKVIEAAVGRIEARESPSLQSIGGLAVGEDSRDGALSVPEQGAHVGALSEEPAETGGVL